MTDRLTLRNVSVNRGRTQVIDRVSLSLHAGQIVALIGPNGAGKSSLLNTIAGSIPHSGRILWDGMPVDRKCIGFMPQNCAVKAELSVLQTLLLGRHEQLGWRIGGHDIDAAGRMLEEFGLKHLAERCINTLSGGQQQLVLLAQRMMRQPRLLILDEATCALDLRHQLVVLDRLRAYVKRTGALVLMAIHDLNLAARNGDTLLLLHRGRLEATGSGAEVLTSARLRAVYGIEAHIVEHGQYGSFILPVSPLAESTILTAALSPQTNTLSALPQAS